MATGDTFAITLLSDAAMTPWKSGEWLILHAMHAAHRELGIVGAVQHGIEYAEVRHDDNIDDVGRVRGYMRTAHVLEKGASALLDVGHAFIPEHGLEWQPRLVLRIQELRVRQLS